MPFDDFHPSKSLAGEASEHPWDGKSGPLVLGEESVEPLNPYCQLFQTRTEDETCSFIKVLKPSNLISPGGSS
jgi:hypothetical protein